MTQSERDAVRNAALDWIKHDCPLTIKMVLTPKHLDRLLDRLDGAVGEEPTK